MHDLRDRGNTLLVVEHEEAIIRSSDHVIDIGPGRGEHGGELVWSGALKEFLGGSRPPGAMANKIAQRSRMSPESIRGFRLTSPAERPIHQSLTRDYLTGRRAIQIRESRRSLRTVTNWVEIRGARANNLRNIHVRFPVGRLSVITGISGSGKSTLMHDVLLPAVIEQLENRRRSGNGELFKLVSGTEEIEAVYEVDQSPIGKTSRSTPATYVKVFDEIRNLYAQLPVSRVRGYSASRFSFNAEGGRCETCKGQGVIKLEMNFLPDTLVPCQDCGGKRYNSQTLEVLYNDKSIGDVMEMTIEEAAEFFSAHPKIARPLTLLNDTGLGYLKLGQPSPTLSGGEAQRLKLVTQLKRGVGRAQNERIRKMRKPGSTLYLLEEPTIGLHMADIELLIKVLHRLVDEGNTVIVIEHNLSVIAEADYIVDLGPEAGAAGGRVVATGTPEQVAKNKTSRTAPFLRKSLSSNRAPKMVLPEG